jgi:uncharacterized protein
MRALLSIHDVMPATRPAVVSLLAQLYLSVPTLRPSDITLLVVPGTGWGDGDLLWLHRLARAGHPLAGHGWCHRAPDRRTLWHRLHGMVLSRDAAEHLSRPEHELAALMLRCHAWFAQQDLAAGPLYVPPAWAVGRIGKTALASMPFLLLEDLAGIRLLRQQQHIRLPLAGYEADTDLRAGLLSVNNAAQFHLAKITDRPLRFGLHPFDAGHRLGDRLIQDLCRVTQFCDYGSLLRSR